MSRRSSLLTTKGVKATLPQVIASSVHLLVVLVFMASAVGVTAAYAMPGLQNPSAFRPETPGGLELTDGSQPGTVYSGGNASAEASPASDASAACGPDPALVGCWQMEEGTGSTTLTDGSSFANNAVITGTPIWTTPGQTGTYALQLGTGNPYASAPDSDSLDIATNRLTIAAWIKPTVTGNTTQSVIVKDLFSGGTQVAGYELNLSSAGKVFLRLNNSASARVDSVTAYPLNGTAWMHVAGTYDGATMRMYINGTLDNTLAASVTINTNTLPLTIGRQTGTDPRPYSGYLDDVRIYNR